MERPSRLLDDALSRLFVSLDEDGRSRLDAYIGELELWNPVYKLVGSHGDDLIIRHIVDSLAAVPLIEERLASVPSPSLVDLGSGAGLPGIPLAIAMPSCHVTLVERMERRAGFLRNVVARCRLADRVEVLARDLDSVHGRFDGIVFRAFRPLPLILDSVGTLLDEHGCVFAYKGRKDVVEEELRQVKLVCRTQWRTSLHPLSVPYLAEPRVLCLLEKE